MRPYQATKGGRRCPEGRGAVPVGPAKPVAASASDGGPTPRCPDPKALGACLTEFHVDERPIPLVLGEQNKMRAPLIALVALIVAGAAVGGYVIGDSSGANLEAARSEGAAAGEGSGRAAGRKAGYAAGFRKARPAAFEQAYAPAYRSAYREEFAQAGLKEPDVVKVSGR